MSDVTPTDQPARPAADTEPTVEVEPTPVSSADTAQLPAASLVTFPPGLWLVFLLVAAAGLLVGIAVAAASRSGPRGAVVAEATIGSDGGTLSFGHHGLLRVPDGAVAHPTRVWVRQSVVPERLRIAPPTGPLYVFEPHRLVAYTFGPTDLTFQTPVSIVLPLDRTGMDGTAFVVSHNTAVFLGGNADAKAGTIALKVTDFRFQSASVPRQ